MDLKLLRESITQESREFSDRHTGSNSCRHIQNHMLESQNEKKMCFYGVLVPISISGAEC